MSAPTAPALPHGRPFVYVDRVIVGDSPEKSRTLLRITVGTTCQGDVSAPMSASILLEAMAQSALALLTAAGGDGETSEGRGALVGIDEARFDEALCLEPPQSGDTLEGFCEVRGRFGRMAKVGVRLERGGQDVASAELLLASG